MSKIVVEITVVGKDREGVVAGFTNFIFQNGGNIEKINQNVIKGLFGMYLEASFTKQFDAQKFNLEAERLAKKLKMEANIHYEAPRRKRVAVLVTKEPHCLQAILEARRKKQLRGEIAVLVGTEKTLAKMARKAKIPFVPVNEKEQTTAEDKIIAIMKKSVKKNYSKLQNDIWFMRP